ncbi:MAG TPA: hypothetical protein VLK33_19825 [Terriglobales bacterium]|nr:hypothetical protein [Terriglobales bacterium]
MDESYLDDGTQTDAGEQGNDILSTFLTASAGVITAAIKPNPSSPTPPVASAPVKPQAPINSMLLLGVAAVIIVVLIVK